MKKLMTFFIILMILIPIIYDLKEGVLQSFNQDKIITENIQPAMATVEQNEVVEVDNVSIPYILMDTLPGSTVLSLAEKAQNGSVPVSLEKLVEDFKTLNPNTEPEKIQIGKTYKIPIYK